MLMIDGLCVCVCCGWGWGKGGIQVVFEQTLWEVSDRILWTREQEENVCLDQLRNSTSQFVILCLDFVCYCMRTFCVIMCCVLLCVVDRTGSGSCAVVVLVLAVLNLCVLLPENQLIGEMDLMEICCEDGIWIDLAQDR